jgi:spermidine synthase
MLVKKSDVWYSEYHSKTRQVVFKIDKCSHGQSPSNQLFKKRPLEIYGSGWLCTSNRKDEFVYHDMITHQAAVNPESKGLIIGGGDGGTANFPLCFY